MHKYLFKPYQDFYLELFKIESAKIKDIFANHNYKIEINHIGSTAIKGLGGKGIVDILITTEVDIMERVSLELIKKGYLFSKTGGDEHRLFHYKKITVDNFKDYSFHVHVTHFNSRDHKEIIFFRDYLKNNPKEIEAYTKIKEDASKKAIQFDDLKKAREIYTGVKSPFIKEILSRL